MSDYTTADAYPVIAEQDMDLPSGAHVRVRRPSMFMMLRRGQVPAEVREIVARIDAAREREAETGEPMEPLPDSDLFTVLDCLVAAAFVQPRVTFARTKGKGALCVEDIPDDDRMAIVAALGLREVV